MVNVHPKPLSRRDFLKLGGVTSLALASSTCDLAPAATLPSTSINTSQPTRASTWTPAVTSSLTPTRANTVSRQTPGPPSLRALADRIGLQIGTAINGGWFSDSQYQAKYKEVIGREFNVAVVNWGLYWPEVEPKLGQFEFSTADKQISFAQQKNMTVRGHPLVFPTASFAIADWVVKGNFSPDQLMKILRNQISFAGKWPVFVVG